MSRDNSSTKKTQKKASVRVFQGHQKIQSRPNSGSKFMQRKIFTHSDACKVVGVKCRLPSATAFNKNTPNVYEENNRKIREKMKEVRDKYSPRMKELYINPKKTDSEIIPAKPTKNASIQSPPVPKSNPKPLKPSTQVKNRVVQTQSSQKNCTPIKFENSSGNIQSDAHKMIWFWFFNGLSISKETEGNC